MWPGISYFNNFYIIYAKICIFFLEISDWIKFKLSLKLFEPIKEEDIEPNVPCYYYPFFKFRAWFLYTLYPCNFILLTINYL
jgi:hypothetical protein